MIKENSKRVVITGLGVMTSIGDTVPSFEKALFEGRCGIGPVSLFDTKGFHTRTAAQIRSENLKVNFQTNDIKHASRCDILGLIAAREAFSNA